MISQASFFIFISNLSKFMFNLPLYLCYFIRACTRSVIQTFNRKEKCLNGETVLITGAASGIGRHVTYLLAKRFPDAKYILWDINQAELNTTTAHCQKLGAITVHTYVVNLSNLKEIKDTAARVKNDVGHVSILLNNAGIAACTSFVDTDAIQEETVIKVNLLAYMWTIREFLPGMISRGKGHLVSTLSILSFTRFQGQSCYSAAKYGLRGFLESLELELRQHPDKPNIKFTNIYPAVINTPMSEGKIFWRYRYDIPGWKPLDLNYAAECIVDGIIKERKSFVIPKSFLFMDLMQRVLPTRFLDIFENHVLIFDGENTFQSHK